MLGGWLMRAMLHRSSGCAVARWHVLCSDVMELGCTPRLLHLLHHALCITAAPSPSCSLLRISTSAPTPSCPSLCIKNTAAPSSCCCARRCRTALSRSLPRCSSACHCSGGPHPAAATGQGGGTRLGVRPPVTALHLKLCVCVRLCQLPFHTEKLETIRNSCVARDSFHQKPSFPCFLAALPDRPPLPPRGGACRDEHSHEAEVLLHELLLQRLRVSSAGASNSAGSGGSGGTAAARGSGAVSGGTGQGSGEGEATLALHLHHQHHHQRHNLQQSGATGSGGTAASGDVLSLALAPPYLQQQPPLEPTQLAQQGRQHDRQQPARPVTAPAPGGGGEQQRRRALPAVATRLPLHLQHLQAQAVGGTSGEVTPHSARSIESAWSDSGVWGCCVGWCAVKAVQIVPSFPRLWIETENTQAACKPLQSTTSLTPLRSG